MISEKIPLDCFILYHLFVVGNNWSNWSVKKIMCVKKMCGFSLFKTHAAVQTEDLLCLCGQGLNEKRPHIESFQTFFQWPFHRPWLADGQVPVMKSSLRLWSWELSGRRDEIRRHAAQRDQSRIKIRGTSRQQHSDSWLRKPFLKLLNEHWLFPPEASSTARKNKIHLTFTPLIFNCILICVFFMTREMMKWKKMMMKCLKCMNVSHGLTAPNLFGLKAWVQCSEACAPCCNQ